MTDRPRVAFVVPRYGVEVNGGAEYLCRSLARALAAEWDIEIFTTRAIDFVTWNDHYDRGDEMIDGAVVHRFSVDAPRDIETFNALSETFLRELKTAPLARQEDWMRAQGPYSSELFEALERSRERFSAVVFFTYLYATTYFGLPLVAERAWLMPFAHDEWPLAASMWDARFALPRALVFSSIEERALLSRRFPGIDRRGRLIGTGIDVPREAPSAHVIEKYGLPENYVLYLGRVDPAKGIDELLDFFAFHRRASGDDATLVLAGRPTMQLPALPYVRAIGFMDEGEKASLLCGADVVVMPSMYESLSLVLLEAWSVGRPVLVTQASDVLVGQVRRASGGLWYSDAEQFSAALTMLRGTIGDELGGAGRNYVENNYAWPTILEQYRRLLADTSI